MKPKCEGDRITRKFKTKVLLRHGRLLFPTYVEGPRRRSGEGGWSSVDVGAKKSALFLCVLDHDEAATVRRHCHQLGHHGDYLSSSSTTCAADRLVLDVNIHLLAIKHHSPTFRLSARHIINSCRPSFHTKDNIIFLHLPISSHYQPNRLRLLGELLTPPVVQKSRGHTLQTINPHPR